MSCCAGMYACGACVVRVGCSSNCGAAQSSCTRRFAAVLCRPFAHIVRMCALCGSPPFLWRRLMKKLLPGSVKSINKSKMPFARRVRGTCVAPA